MMVGGMMIVTMIQINLFIYIDQFPVDPTTSVGDM